MHTPGPWWIPVNGRETAVLGGDKEDPLIVAECEVNDPMGMDPDTAVENARLIAQAPAMLAFLRNLTSTRGSLDIDDPNTGRNIALRDEARAILRAVEG